MDCGKSTMLLQVAHNYESQGFKIIIIKPSFDTRDSDMIKSRLGMQRKVDISLKQYANIFCIIKNLKEKPYCILVDESNFLTKQQARQMWEIAVLLDITVICFGLRTSYTGEGFEGSKELLVLAHKIEEIKSIDSDGNKCTMHLRKVNGEYIFDGIPTIVGDTDVYESCSAEKWLAKYIENKGDKYD